MKRLPPRLAPGSGPSVGETSPPRSGFSAPQRIGPPLLVDGLPHVVWTARADGAVDYVNSEWQVLTGAAAEQAVGSGWFTFVHPDDRVVLESRWSHSIATGTALSCEVRIRRARDGAFRWHLAKATYREKTDGQRGWFGCLVDIDEIHQGSVAVTAEKERMSGAAREAGSRLAQQLAFTRGITDCIKQGIYAVDLNGRATFVNPAAERMLGWETAELLGRDMHEVIHYQHADHSAFPKETCPLIGVLRSGSHVRVDEDVFTRRDGTFLSVAYTSAPVTEGGRIVGAVVSFDDISDRKRRDEAMRQSEQQLRAALEEVKQAKQALERRVEERTAELREINGQLRLSNRELQDFASVASHDLQEPLRKIQAFGDRLANQAEKTLGPESLDYLRRMKNAAGRMQTLINDLLSFSRVTTKAAPFVPTDLKQVAQEVLGDLEDSLTRNQGRVELGDLPVIDADPLQMRQLLQNLIANSLKFHKLGVGPVVRVGARDVKFAADGGSVLIDAIELWVQDDGIGFEEKYLDRIFNVFQRLHGRSAYEGTGIGLAVCRKIAERHGGMITARSIPNEGATFVVTLPIRHGPAAAGKGEG